MPRAELRERVRRVRGLGAVRQRYVRAKYELKAGGRSGPGGKDDKEGTTLNRVIRWCLDALEHGADPMQAEKLVYELGLAGAKPVVTFGAKPAQEQVSKDKTEQGKHDKQDAGW